MFNRQFKKKREVKFELIPMIDVMMILVLFLAVMAFLPSVQSAIQTDLPKSTSDDKLTDDDIVLNINADGIMSIGEDSLSQNELIPRLQELLNASDQDRVVISADKKLNYEYVVNILAMLRASGIKNVALATEFQAEASP